MWKAHNAISFENVISLSLSLSLSLSFYLSKGLKGLNYLTCKHFFKEQALA